MPQCMGSQRVGHDLATEKQLCNHKCPYKKEMEGDLTPKRRRPRDHSGRDRKRSVMATRVRQGCGHRGPCAGGGPDVHSVLLRWTLAGS